jgi:hypothetical protein
VLSLDPSTVSSSSFVVMALVVRVSARWQGEKPMSTTFLTDAGRARLPRIAQRMKARDHRLTNLNQRHVGIIDRTSSSESPARISHMRARVIHDT